ncbi:MAG: D-2-hydroxyacid dehydrogenase [Epsilonproteobacteria bacterium]|nr:D-2-hydroxyacid dehydrogenase [Campylobacterota bacterium]
MKIIFLDAKTVGKDVSLKRFKKLGNFKAYKTTKKHQTPSRVKDADIIITNKVVIDKSVIKQAKKLKLICVAATGMNNIDLKYATKKGIKVKNVKDYSTPSVAQHTFSMLFYLIGKSCYYDRYTKSKKWSKSDIFTNLDKPFFEIKDKKWGIIGLGTIGKEVAKIATAFGCNVSYYSTSGKNRSSDFKRVDLKKLLKESDIISIHAPLNEKTNNLITKKELSLLKEGAVLLNLGRGGIVNEKDLAKTLDKKDIYVGLDVTSKEPIEADSALLNIKNKDRLFITPHIAWASKESRERLVEKIYQNIKEELKDGKRA